MDKYYKNYLRLFSLVFTFAVFVIVFDKEQITLPVKSSFEFGLVIGYSLHIL